MCDLCDTCPSCSNDGAKLRLAFQVDCTSVLAGFEPQYLVVAVRLPNKSVEIITNTQNIPSKMEYYRNAYDDNFKLKTCPDIQIINYMLV